ncbi:MAG: hypothetical protein WDM88_00235 [Galbitalea sp.]
MTVPRAWMRSAVEPAVAVVFFLLWSIDDVGRLQGPNLGLFAAHWAPLVLIGVAIGASRLVPWLSIGSLVGLFVLQLLVVGSRFTEDAWPVYGGVGLAVIGLASTRSRGSAGASPFRSARRSGVAVALFLLAPWLGPDPSRSLLTGWRLDEPDLGSQLFIWGIAAAGAMVGGWFIGHALYSADERAALRRAQVDVERSLAQAESELQAIRERGPHRAGRARHIMAHSLSVIIAQADGARFLADTRGVPPQDSLVAIAGSARESLVEVRMLIDSLAPEPEGHSVPGLADIPALVERMRAAGLSVETATSGEPCALTASQQMAVYRISQEGLTNAMKHAGRDAAATLELAWRGSGLELCIRSRGLDPSPAPRLCRPRRAGDDRAGQDGWRLVDRGARRTRRRSVRGEGVRAPRPRCPWWPTRGTSTSGSGRRERGHSRRHRRRPGAVLLRHRDAGALAGRPRVRRRRLRR